MTMLTRVRGGARTSSRASTILPVLAAILVILALTSLCVGRFPIPLRTALAILAAWPFDAHGAWTEMQQRIVTQVRVPRVLLSILCGGGLALCGAALQGLFRNPLVSPHILGVSSGASLGGALAILIGLSGAALVSSAFVTGFAALGLVGALASTNRADTLAIVLSGVVVAAFFTALVSLTMVVANPETSLPGIVFWLMGSFSATTPAKLASAAPIILPGAGILIALRFRINVLSLGDDDVRALGLSVERDRWIVLGTVALVEATVVAHAGVIGWVGLVVPHAARVLVGPDHRVLLPAAALLGGCYLVSIDTLARSLTSAEIPLGVLTAVVGAPAFALILWRKQQRDAER